MLPKSGSSSPWQYHNRATAHHGPPALREINLTPRDLTWHERTLAAESARAGAPRARQPAPRGCRQPCPRSRYRLAGGRPCRDSIAWEWQPPRPWGCGHTPRGTSFLGVGLSRASHRGDKGRSGPLPEGGRGTGESRPAPGTAHTGTRSRSARSPPRPAPIKSPQPRGQAEAGCFLLRVNKVSREEGVVVLGYRLLTPTLKWLCFVWCFFF